MALKATMVQTQKVKVCKMYFGTFIINLLKVVLPKMWQNARCR